MAPAARRRSAARPKFRLLVDRLLQEEGPWCPRRNGLWRKFDRRQPQAPDHRARKEHLALEKESGRVSSPPDRVDRKPFAADSRREFLPAVESPLETRGRLGPEPEVRLASAARGSPLHSTVAWRAVRRCASPGGLHEMTPPGGGLSGWFSRRARGLQVTPGPGVERAIANAATVRSLSCPSLRRRNMFCRAVRNAPPDSDVLLQTTARGRRLIRAIAYVVEARRSIRRDSSRSCSRSATR